jgi:hypothetical protein
LPCKDATSPIVTMRVTGPQTTVLASISHPSPGRSWSVAACTLHDRVQSIGALRIALKDTCSLDTVDMLSPDLHPAWRPLREQAMAHVHPASRDSHC